MEGRVVVMCVSLDLSLVMVVITAATCGASVVHQGLLLLGGGMGMAVIVINHGCKTDSANARGLTHVDDGGDAFTRFSGLVNTCTNATI